MCGAGRGMQGCGWGGAGRCAKRGSWRGTQGPNSCPACGEQGWSTSSSCRGTPPPRAGRWGTRAPHTTINQPPRGSDVNTHVVLHHHGQLLGQLQHHVRRQRRGLQRRGAKWMQVWIVVDLQHDSWRRPGHSACLPKWTTGGQLPSIPPKAGRCPCPPSLASSFSPPWQRS